MANTHGDSRKPLRQCRVCRERRGKEHLFRFAERDGLMVPSEGRNSFGRGFYVCRRSGCVERLVRPGSVGKVIPARMSPEGLRLVSGVLEVPLEPQFES